MYRTEQEPFWAGEFGNDYIERNNSGKRLAAKTAMLARMLARVTGVRSILELGANVGLNIRALRTLLPDARLEAVEINEAAYQELTQIPDVIAHHTSLLDHRQTVPVDFSFTIGVLIHLNPDVLPSAYQVLYESSSRYIAISEYYNPSPIELPYRGHSGRLFKRDFAGEMMTRYSDLRLIDYGFVYHRDPMFPGDDLTWFVMEKEQRVHSGSIAM
jgi:pseudaminic acid biosynthesis-associated methylase